MEENILLDFLHEHPLRRITNVAAEAGYKNSCYGCMRYFLPGEAVYGCSRSCGFPYCLHEECAEMAREIRHPLHPSHPLKLKEKRKGSDTLCSVCDDPLTYSGLGYICGEGCELGIHLACAGDGVVVEGELMEHTQHDLRLLRRKNMSFECDACGIIKKDGSYVCTKCNYLIHESCASLPTNKHFHHHPDHSLSLAFYPPREYIKNHYTCYICDRALRLRHWVYHCALCRYVVHLNCATASNSIDDENAEYGEDDILNAPVHHIYEEMIKPFVLRERGQISISHDNQIITTYKFHQEGHPLRLTKFSSSCDDKEEGDSSDDDDDVEKLTCNGCGLHIHEKSRDKGYMSCGECKYFLHLACFNLPSELPSHPLHQINHKLSLQSAGKLSNLADCDVCHYSTNGLFYSCSECSFKIDIKCASLPNIITHAGHPELGHFVKLVTHNHETSFCNACYQTISADWNYYKCDSCRFSVCCQCVLLPASNKHRLEKHMLPLTYDASVNHPGDFYCSNCELPMNPKSWMYHCRQCDQSFHPRCFPAGSV